ncbi:chlorophyll a-b binding protein CP26, chloroplastic isoform X3 [Physcomitrium patens]|uniref:chlorophyll a-b binding protein CP26, chloroplastic isoform X3 n=1 Tax=Physcomitrium patens TaxID=3218 RepID=UPI000D155B43|nr:chlorophyll a-b binding protein CP26, chloroplastic-like isoform X1 [Physcomitrium patens]|eukprot:XP_024374442.1 chlorophyll a-b binding protein CP26, chloroplastic-like isoform X1 [Physcomitrella patens]
MPGAAGFVLPEAFNKFGAVCGPEAVWRKTGGLLLEGDSIKYFGATIPINLAAAVIAEVILVRGAEFYRILTDYTQEERSTLWVLPMIPNSSSC